MHDGAAGGAAAMALIEVDEWLAVCALKACVPIGRGFFVIGDLRLSGDSEGVTGCEAALSSRMRAKCEEKEPWRLPGRETGCTRLDAAHRPPLPCCWPSLGGDGGLTATTDPCPGSPVVGMIRSLSSATRTMPMVRVDGQRRHTPSWLSLVAGRLHRGYLCGM